MQTYVMELMEQEMLIVAKALDIVAGGVYDDHAQDVENMARLFWDKLDRPRDK